jgi:SAM-dependent methyltransferase
MDIFDSKAHAYHIVAPVLVPGYDFLQTEAVKLLPFTEKDVFQFVDLGSGSGRLLRKVLDNFPHARGIWCDRNPDSRAVAETYLEDHKDRIAYVEADLVNGWSCDIPGQFDAIVSMSAIHHLKREAKQHLFSQCYKHLAPGGVFINVDEVRALDMAEYLANIKFWLIHAERMASCLPNSDYAYYYNKWCKRFKSGNKGHRGMTDEGLEKYDNSDHPADAQLWQNNVRQWLFHRRLDSVENQLQWLKDAGFSHVWAPIKYYLWACMYAEKPCADNIE